MIKHFLIPSALIVLAAMSSCSPNDDKLNKTYTDQLAPGSLTNATLKWTSAAPGDKNGGGQILMMALGTTGSIAFNVAVTKAADAADRYSYIASGTVGFLSIEIGQLHWRGVNDAHFYGVDFKGLHSGVADAACKSFFSRSFFGKGEYTQTPFRINFLSFNGFKGYKAEIFIPRGAIWAGQYQAIDQATVTVPVDITFNF